jgi:hypothetical protein
MRRVEERRLVDLAKPEATMAKGDRGLIVGRQIGWDRWRAMSR